MPDNWYSDAALAKQAALEAHPEGAPIDLEMFCGVWEPRTQPTDAERCPCCGGDAREGAGGSGTHCSICVGRGHEDDDA